MNDTQTATSLDRERILLDSLEAAWKRTDEIFSMVPERSLLERPIDQRHPLLFYIGHLPAFAWNMIGRDLLGRPSAKPEFDQLFDFGIDPEEGEEVAEPTWPPLPEVLAYRDGVRADVRGAIGELAALDDAPMAQGGKVLELVLEHELMHHETLLYMLQELDAVHKKQPAWWKAPTLGDAHLQPDWVEVPGGHVPLGTDRGAEEFLWDNESPARAVEVDTFRMTRVPVTVAEFEAFANEGGYEARELWTEDDWKWRCKQDLLHPKDWVVRHGRRWMRTMFERVPLEDVGGWPACTSLAEARAFARWKGARLPTEAEFLRAAYGDESDCAYPWGTAEPVSPQANLSLSHHSPTPVGSHPLGASPFGIHDLLGNGWEWTTSVFEGHEGFDAYVPGYTGYSKDFFDGQHFVMLGGSWATDAKLARRTFRNWFRDNYPYPFTQFRLVEA